MTDVVVGTITFCIVITLLATTAGLLITFFLAIPVFWLLMVVSRGLGHVERSRGAALLGLELADPVPPLQAASWWRRLLERARSGVRWKEVGYLLLLLPLGVLNLVLLMAAWCGSLALLTLPLYVSELPDGTAKFWFSDVAAGGDAWLVALVGLIADVAGSVQMVTAASPAELGRMIDLRVARGALGDVGDDGVAVSSDFAEQHAVDVGASVPVTFADGQRVDLRVGAVYDANMSFGDVVVPEAQWLANTQQPALTGVFVRLADGVGRSTRVAPRRRPSRAASSRPRCRIGPSTLTA